VPRWSELADDLDRLDVELSAVGVTWRDLAADIHDVPEYRERCENLTEKQCLLLALRYFGDEQNPQPRRETRSEWMYTGYTTDWGHLPPLDEAGKPKSRKPRHRPPDPIPDDTVKRLKWELAQREAKPRDREFTQEKIADRLGLDRSRVQQAEALRRAGWDLLRSHPEFSANDGFVRWPSAAEAARLLASERAENSDAA